MLRLPHSNPAPHDFIFQPHVEGSGRFEIPNAAVAHSMPPVHSLSPRCSPSAHDEKRVEGSKEIENVSVRMLLMLVAFEI